MPTTRTEACKQLQKDMEEVIRPFDIDIADDDQKSVAALYNSVGDGLSKLVALIQRIQC